MSFFCPPLMSAAPDLRASRIRALQQTYSAQQQDLPVLEEQIRLLRDAVTDPGHSGELHVDSISLARHHYDLGVALHEHFMHLRDFKDLETAEAHLRIAICGSSLGVGLPEPASILGSVLYERARELRRTEMAEESVQLHRRSLSANSDMHPLQKARLSRELGRSLHVYQSMIKDGEEALSESVARLNDARNWYAEADVSDHLTLLALCESLCSLFRLKHEEPLLRDAFSCATLALRTISSSHRDFFWAIWMLARVQTGLAAFFREEEPLEQAIDTLRVLLADAPSVWRRILADRFGEALRLRFLTQGREEDLGELIECFTDILDGMTPNESHWDTLQWGLSIALSLRFSIAGLPEDIEAAARAADFAASVVKDNSVLLWDRLIQVAICRSEQFMAFGDEAHLEESTALLQQVVEQAPFRSLTWQVAARNLIAASSQRYEYTGNAVDLDKAIELIPPLIESPKGQSYYAPGDLGCAGEAFLLRFQARGVVEDLNQAVALLRRAVDATSIVSFRSNELFHEYAKTLRIHYEVLHDKESATRAFEIQKQLVDSLPDTHPDRAGVLCGLARLQLCTDPNQDGLAHVLVSLLDALKNSYCPAYKRLKEVSEILTYMVGSGMPCLDYKMIPQLCTVYSTAIALLPQVASFGLEPHVRLSVIGGAGSLTTQGAVHAISSRQPGLAVEMLESGRTVFWTQGLQLRTSFADLPEAMGDRLAKITYALARPIPDSASAGPTKDRELARRRQLGDDFKSVIDEARLIPGFEDLLRNLPFLALAKAAARNPIVVLVADGAVGHAIIVEEEVRCRLVTLQGVTAKVLEALAHRIEKQSRHARSSRGMRKVKVMEDQVADVYCELWTSIMHPIIEVLEWPRSEGRLRRRLVLCPTGAFMQLPLHAAGIYAGDDQACCSDYFVSSYTPSIAALLHAQKSVKPLGRSEAGTLIVAVDRPFQGSSLPMTTKEADEVQRLVSPYSKVVQASNCQEVLERIGSATILHLACHGTQHLGNPLQSSFHLEDGMLPVSKLVDLDLPSAFLAVLSACETAKGDAAQPDQAIHLAASMLFAGFKSVVATMWFMGDRDGPIIAESIYSRLFNKDSTSEYLDPDDVPYALDDAVQKLRQSGLDPSFWATYIHLGI